MTKVVLERKHASEMIGALTSTNHKNIVVCGNSTKQQMWNCVKSIFDKIQ